MNRDIRLLVIEALEGPNHEHGILPPAAMTRLTDALAPFQTRRDSMQVVIDLAREKGGLPEQLAEILEDEHQWIAYRERQLERATSAYHELAKVIENVRDWSNADPAGTDEEDAADLQQIIEQGYAVLKKHEKGFARAH